MFLSTLTTTVAPLIGLLFSSTNLPVMFMLLLAFTGLVVSTVIVVFSFVTVMLLNGSGFSGSAV